MRGGTPPAKSIEAVQIAPPPPLRKIPKHLPPGDLGLVLAALGVEEDMRDPISSLNWIPSRPAAGATGRARETESRGREIAN